jgi:hypothetical protein
MNRTDAKGEKCRESLVKVMGILVAGSITTAGSLAAAKGRRPEGAARVPVVIELFTSEGCSSCPPADDLLARLVATQPVEGAEILALGEHVDYWDHLGWRDPFSAQIFGERQTDYDEKAFHRGNVYTPQMVVDGRTQFTGSDEDAAIAAVKQAIRRPGLRLQVTLDVRHDPGSRTIAVSTRVTVPPEVKLSGETEVVLALAQDGLESQVRGGENGGRRLRHSAVVRSFRSIGHLRGGDADWSGSSQLDLSEEGKAGTFRIVVFVQERKSRRIVGAGSAVVTGDLHAP